ncbi:MAG: glycosyltransferase family 2 protein [Erysipelotrichaceae bacterium]|nr:glycosyltransferase family 2 protein [Erysipelotrichaceae bacterium]
MEMISFVIPCYRSEKTIGIVVEEIEKLMSQHDPFTYEVVLVNDCSPDNVWDVIREMGKKDKRIKGICLAKNFGQHSALMAGYKVCKGDYIVTLDDDGQTPVEETFKLMDKLFEGYDVVYARYEERKDNLFRKLGTAMNNLMLQILSGKPKELHLTSFFVARKFIIEEICRYEHSYPYIWGLILRTTRNIANQMIRHNERKEGKSGYTLIKLLSLWMNGFTAFSVIPLRIVSYMGMFLTVCGFFGIIFTVVNKLLHPSIQAGYSALMTVQLIIGGMLMISNGLMGEYIGRIYMGINAAPQYVTKEKVNLEEDPDA